MPTNLLTYSRRKWRAAGYYVEGTESIMRLPGGSTVRRDLFGCVDLLAIPPDGPWVYLQVTSRSNMSARAKKILTEKTGKGQWAMPIAELARRIRGHGDTLIVEGWEKKNGVWVDWERPIWQEV